ncbi:Scr1 family TA system antitoxin-like transcriptional regulator [Stackebrandtia endophytica]|uniref:Scr1 family TA system antitoxin-like transcriptional regulator n=1 Tax=Stackebrandtia endophytica TaxID=1496996 RepID=UPI0036452C07
MSGTTERGKFTSEKVECAGPGLTPLRLWPEIAHTSEAISPHVVYIENLVARTFLEEESKVERYRQAYDRLQDQTLTPSESVGFIRKILQEIETPQIARHSLRPGHGLSPQELKPCPLTLV